MSTLPSPPISAIRESNDSDTDRESSVPPALSISDAAATKIVTHPPMGMFRANLNDEDKDIILHGDSLTKVANQLIVSAKYLRKEADLAKTLLVKNSEMFNRWTEDVAKIKDDDQQRRDFFTKPISEIVSKEKYSVDPKVAAEIAKASYEDFEAPPASEISSLPSAKRKKTTHNPRDELNFIGRIQDRIKNTIEAAISDADELQVYAEKIKEQEALYALNRNQPLPLPPPIPASLQDSLPGWSAEGTRKSLEAPIQIQVDSCT
eukprot:TRINITY_DN25300_c0_g1_i1.p1 TRINITY_DN25300_c0_g1~~TRINITY_DN25300_c0_g1_i1.p1  ORF type:complete len:309 (-),score=28.07 TRINITY_DN25300_c0_g1_i1:2-790(-)